MSTLKQIKTRMNRLKRGDLIYITFLDHCQMNGGATKLLPIKVIGWFVEKNDNSLTVAVWVCENELNGPNTDTYTVLLHDGMEIQKIRMDK